MCDQISVITVYYREGMNSSILPPPRTYSEKRIERSMPALSRNNFTRIMYQRVVPKQRYIVRKSKTREMMLLPEGSVGIIKH